MQAILFYVGLNQSNEPNDFHKRLHIAFGIGTMPLEKVIVRELYHRVNMPYVESGEFDFARYVNLARAQYNSKPIEIEKSDR